MTIKLNYTPNFSGLQILKTRLEQSDFFGSGHPCFLIPDFCKLPSDIWTSFLDYIERKEGLEIYDQDGGSIEEYKINENTGRTRCKYIAYDVQKNETDTPENIVVYVEGFVVRNQEKEVYFLATNVESD